MSAHRSRNWRLSPLVVAPPPSFAWVSFRTEPQIYLVSVGNFELFEGWWMFGWTKPSWAPCLVGWWRVGRWLGWHQWRWDGSMHGGSGGPFGAARNLLPPQIHILVRYASRERAENIFVAHVATPKRLCLCSKNPRQSMLVNF